MKETLRAGFAAVAATRLELALDEAFEAHGAALKAFTESLALSIAGVTEEDLADPGCMPEELVNEWRLVEQLNHHIRETRRLCRELRARATYTAEVDDATDPTVADLLAAELGPRRRVLA